MLAHGMDAYRQEWQAQRRSSAGVHLMAAVVTRRRTILSSASLYNALCCALGFHTRRVLQVTRQ